MFFLLKHLPNRRLRDRYFLWALKDKIFRAVYVRRYQTLIGWLRVSRKSMNNIPGFIKFLQMRLPEKLNDTKE